MSLRGPNGLRARDHMGNLAEDKGRQPYSLASRRRYGGAAVGSAVKGSHQEEPASDTSETTHQEEGGEVVAAAAELAVNGAVAAIDQEPTGGTPEQTLGAQMGPAPEAGL